MQRVFAGGGFDAAHSRSLWEGQVRGGGGGGRGREGIIILGLTVTVALRHEGPGAPGILGHLASLPVPRMQGSRAALFRIVPVDVAPTLDLFMPSVRCDFCDLPSPQCT